MLKTFALLVSFGCCIHVQCQSASYCSDFDRLIAEGNKLLEQSIPRFYEAFKKYQSAEAVACSTEKANLAKQKIETLFVRVDKLRETAIINEKNANHARSQALENYKIAQAATERAIVAKLEAEQNLNNYKRASASIVDFITSRANLYILKMDYASAHEELVKASALQIFTSSLKKAVTEVAFWWIETERPDLALSLLKVLKVRELPANGDSLRQFIKSYQPTFYADTLLKRYYPEMILVKGGKFLFGGKTEVVIQDFLMARSETTFWQFGLFCALNERDIFDYNDPSWPFFGEVPIINVTWFDAIEYAHWLNKKFRPTNALSLSREEGTLKTFVGKQDSIVFFKNQFRLPTEAEWEFAANGGSTQKKFIYAGSNSIDSVAWYIRNSKRTNPAGHKGQNSLGLWDLSGNVWEWCLDWYDEKYPSVISNHYEGPIAGVFRVARGGAWDQYDIFCQVLNRNRQLPDERSTKGGFRLVCGTSAPNKN